MRRPKLADISSRSPNWFLNQNSSEIDDERVYDVDRQIPTDALRDPEEISSDESSAEKNFDEDDPATWCITDDFIDLT